jgi:ABC-type uncharacterized transport system involved in gliding motility auxiliary subunit
MAAYQKNSIAARQARFGATAGLYTIIILAALVMVNWLANRYNKTYDTTSNKRFTLSQETKKVVGGLKSDATITYIDRASGFDQAKGMLDRYRNLSPKIHIQYIDLAKQPSLARSYGVRFPGTAYVEIGTKREEAKALTEEGITGAFLKDLKGTRKVCFVTGSHEHQLDETGESGLSTLNKVLGRDNYQAQSISLLEKAEVPKDCAVVVVAGPQLDYTAPQVNALKSYVEGGGRAFILVDPPLDFGRLQIAQNEGLTNLLQSWGVTLEKDLVLEQSQVGQLFGFGPEVPLISSYDSHPIVNDLKGAATGFPLTRSLQVKNGDKTTVEKLFSTKGAAIATTKLNNNQVNPDDPTNKKGPFILAAAGTYNTGQPNNPGRFVVVGSSGFLDNGTIGFQANRDLAVNAINWLSSDEDLISIRPKEPEDRRLNVSQSQMNVFEYTVLIAIPLFLIVSGVSIFLKRR